MVLLVNALGDLVHLGVMLDAQLLVNDVILVLFSKLFKIVSEALARGVGARIERSSLLFPLFEASVHDADVSGTEVAEHPDSAGDRDATIRVIADDCVFLANLQRLHVLFENLTAWESLSVVGPSRDDIIDAELLSRLSQTLITILLVPHVPPGAEDANIGIVLLNELLDIACFDENFGDGQDFERLLLLEVLELFESLKGAILALLDVRFLLVRDHLAVTRDSPVTLRSIRGEVLAAMGKIAILRRHVLPVGRLAHATFDGSVQAPVPVVDRFDFDDVLPVVSHSQVGLIPL